MVDVGFAALAVTTTADDAEVTAGSGSDSSEAAVVALAGGVAVVKAVM